MEAMEALLRRRSAREVTDPGPDDTTLQSILESAACAPDHGRLRPWRFIVIRGAGRERFADVFAEHLRRIQPTASPDSLQREREKAFRAPLIIVVAAICNTGVRVPVIEQILSAGAAAQNIMLAAYALGFNAMWKTGAQAYDDGVKASLGLEPKDGIVGFLYLGTDAAAPSTLTRKSPWELVQYWE